MPMDVTSSFKPQPLRELVNGKEGLRAFYMSQSYGDHENTPEHTVCIRHGHVGLKVGLHASPLFFFGHFLTLHIKMDPPPSFIGACNIHVGGWGGA